MKINEIRSGVCRVMNEILRVMTIQADQGKPLPSVKTFATVRVREGVSTGWGDHSFDGDTEQETVRNRRFIIASVNIFRRKYVQQNVNDETEQEMPMDNARRLEFLMQMEAGIRAMDKEGFGYISVGPIQNLTDVEKAEFEQRVQFDFTFTVSTEYTSSVSRIDSITIGGEVQAEDTIPVNIDVDQT